MRAAQESSLNIMSTCCEGESSPMACHLQGPTFSSSCFDPAGEDHQPDSYWASDCRDFHVFLGGKGSLLQSMDTTDYLPLVWSLPLVGAFPDMTQCSDTPDAIGTVSVTKPVVDPMKHPEIAILDCSSKQLPLSGRHIQRQHLVLNLL